MGQMRFLAPGGQAALETIAQRAYMAGMDGLPWVSRNAVEGDCLVVQRELDESGNLFVPWNVDGHSEVVLSTTSLMGRAEPYHLLVELARGTVNRIRNQLAIWEPAGLAVTQQLTKRLNEATAKLVAAVTSQHDPANAAQQAQQSLAAALDVIGRLGADYTQQVLDIRHRQSPTLSTLLGAGIDAAATVEPHAAAFRDAFNTAIVPFNWRDIEVDEGEFDWSATHDLVRWSRSQNLKTFAGPLLHLAAHHIPDWFYLWEDDFDNIRAYVTQFVDSAVQQFQGKVHLWHAAAGMNTSSALGLTEEQKLRLTVDVIERVRHADPRTPLMVSFDQPWGEYLAAEAMDLSPFYFAETLVRAEVGVAAVGLEINFGYWPGGTLLREPLEISRMIDQWSGLGVPLLILLTIPGGAGEDSHARRAAKPAGDAGLATRESQQQLAHQLVRLLMSKQSVYAVIWSQWSDAQPHEFAHGGLLDAEGKPKPALAALTSIRRKHLS